ncbi:MAG: hypothetical protein PHI35_04020, partial [Victivallaceae bacterium]|nr:hypothetical protein [Victivallaceae bacterium]
MAEIIVASGETSSGLNIPNDGTPLTVQNGGTIVNCVIAEDGTAALAGVGGSVKTIAEGTIIEKGGLMSANQGWISGATEVRSLGVVTLNNYTSMFAGTVSSGGTLNISTGGYVKAVNAQSGAKIIVSGTNARLYASGAGNVMYGVELKGGLVSAYNEAKIYGAKVTGGNMFVLSGAVAYDVTENYYMVVSNGGSAYRTVMLGGSLVVSNSLASGTIMSGGTLNARGNAQVYGTTVNGGFLVASAATASVSGFTVNATGELRVSGGCFASGGTICAGGKMNVWGGTVTGVNAQSGATVVVSGANAKLYASGADIVMYGVELQGGTVSATAEAKIHGANVTGGNMYIQNGAIGSGVSVQAGANLDISGGTVCNAEVYSAANGGMGVMTVSGGATAINTIINNGGKLNTYSGAQVSGLTLNDGFVSLNGGMVSGAVLSGTEINTDKGKLNVRSGATVTDTVVSYGGLLRFESGGGTADGLTTVYSGGMVDVKENGTIAKLDLVTDADYDFGTGTATEYTINGQSLIDNKYFSGDTAYVLDAANLAVTVGAAVDNYSKLTGKDAELTAIATDDGKTTYAGTLDNTYTDTNTAFYAAKGNAANAQKVILDFNGATANKPVCGGGAAGATIAAELEVNVAGGSANYVYGGGQSFNTGAAKVNVNAGGTGGTVYGGANLANGATGLCATTLNIAGKL